MEMLVKMTVVLVKIAVMMMAPGGTPVPPEATGREPPSFFFFFLGLPPRWEESSPSGPWPPWQRRGGSPSEIGSVSLFPSITRSPDLALHGFLNSQRSVTLIALKFLHDFFHKLNTQSYQPRS